MKADELKDKVAQALYEQAATFGGKWKEEQTHVKYRWYDQAEGLMAALDKAGLEIVIKPKAAKKKAKKVEDVPVGPEGTVMDDDPFAVA